MTTAVLVFGTACIVWSLWKLEHATTEAQVYRAGWVAALGLFCVFLVFLVAGAQ